jgi:hypothetical protein
MPQKLDSASMSQQFCERLARLKPESHRQWGSMTPHGMVCHLNDSFRAVLGEKAVSQEITLIGRTVMRWGALHLPIKWPPGVPTRPEMAQETGGTQPVEWAAT